MSIRTYNKDHLKEHVGLSSAYPIQSYAPESGDPLVFWTRHDKEPIEVNLHSFSSGQEQSFHSKGGGKKFIPFTGRPNLIQQLAPAVEENLSYSTRKTVLYLLSALRSWWRILDAVEAAAAKTGQFMARVDDVRLITQFHATFAHRSGMNRHQFNKLRALVDTTCIALGERRTFWESPEEQTSVKHIPPKDQRDSVRFAVRGTCRSVLERWAQYDRLAESDEEPVDRQEYEKWRDVRYMRSTQMKVGKTLPIAEDVQEAIPRWALRKKGKFKLSLRESIFPTHWDADAVWHQCLVNTGWNPSTLTSLDVSQNFLVDHFKDDPKDTHRRFVLSPQTYELVGEKERAGGKDQFVTGQWKTLDGPGHLIKTYLRRVEPLRELLKQQLEREELKYEQMKNADYSERTLQFAIVKTLQQGVRSVWLYVNRQGKVSWIRDSCRGSGMVCGKQVPFMDKVVHSLNTDLAAASARKADSKVHQIMPIPHISPKEFRVWFVDYVYRASYGNILHVKKALNHAWHRTSIGYVDTNILNQEASDSARRFLNILVGELDAGRIDLTILAHLHRYGRVTPEQEQLLEQARILPKSRMMVACRDPLDPPPHIKATADQSCDVQRCLLCQENAVLLPESLDGIAMRTEELRALQGSLPIETWIEDMYEVELKNNISALRKFDLNQCVAAREKWARAIASGEHFVPGLPLPESRDQIKLI